jgi:hypothetical protein
VTISHQLQFFFLLAGAAIGDAQAFQATAPAQSTGRNAYSTHREISAQDHVAWVAQALKRMQTIKPGMTREALLIVFTTEGGLSTGLQRPFISRDCPYFKVDLNSRRSAGRTETGTDG